MLFCCTAVYLTPAEKEKKKRLPECCPLSTAGATVLKGQMLVRTVTALTEVKVSIDWMDGRSHSTFVLLKCCFAPGVNSR